MTSLARPRSAGSAPAARRRYTREGGPRPRTHPRNLRQADPIAERTDDVQRWAAQLAAVQASVSRMNRLTAVAEVGTAVVEETRRVIDYHNCRVYLLEAPDDLVPIAFHGDVGAYEEIPLDLLRTKVGVGFTGWVASHGESLRIDDAMADARGATIAGTDDVDESMIVVPMRSDDVIIGVVTLSKLGLRQFDDLDLQLMSILADAAATAIRSARATDEMRHDERADGSPAGDVERPQPHARPAGRGRPHRPPSVRGCRGGRGRHQLLGPGARQPAQLGLPPAPAAWRRSRLYSPSLSTRSRGGCSRTG